MLAMSASEPTAMDVESTQQVAQADVDADAHAAADTRRMAHEADMRAFSDAQMEGETRTCLLT